MKHHTTILSAVLCAVCLSGCADSNAHSQSMPQAPRNSPCMSRIYFDGHYYVKYDNGGRVSSPSILHDPDCPCRHNRHAKNMHDNPDAPVAMGAQHEPQTITLRHMLADTAFQNQLHQASERAAAEATVRTAEARRRAIGFSHILTKGGEE